MIDDETPTGFEDTLLRALASTPAVAPFIGTERYRVVSCLGEGGFGVVYEVEDRELGRRLALKTLKPQRAGFAANIRRLKREFRSVADLVHPNLVGLHELSSAGSRWFFTMDLVRGRHFLEHVRGDEPKDASGVLSSSRLRSALGQLARGVEALHRHGIVHRDLKPSNVLVEPGGRAVLLDFGLAGEYLPTDLDFAGTPGTPEYAAPEQLAGEPAGPASDWFAVGVMLYQALTGRFPAPALGTSPAAVAERVPEDLDRLCRGLLRRDPRERLDGAAIAEALGERPEPRVARRSALFVGREPELGALRRAFDAVARGEPAVARIHGAPGIGKSALIARFLGELERREHAICLAGRCHERESVPFKAFDGVVDALVAYLRALPRNEASALLPRDVHLVVRLFPALEGVAAIRDVPRRPVPGSRREIRARAFAAIKELAGRVADKQPLVVAIDDLQWGDVDSARLISQLLAPPERPRLLLLLAHRDRQEGWSEGLRQTLRMVDEVGARPLDVSLGALGDDAAERLAVQLVGDSRPNLARQVAARGDGHPLFMSELARTLESGSTSATALPSLLDILWQRVLRLSDGARALLETVAVAGQPLPASLCSEAAGLAASDLDAVRALRAEKLVVTGEGGSIHVFHDRVRDAILERAEPGTRRQRHLALARSLERAPTPDLEALARHFDAAGAGAEAARYAARAGDAAMQSLAFDRAAELYRIAIAGDPDSASLHERLGEALESAGSDAAAGRAYLDAAHLSEGGAAIDLLGRSAEHLLQVGEVEAGDQALDEALAAVGERRPGSPRRAVLEAFYHYMHLRIRGFGIGERAASDAVDPRELTRLEVLDSSACGLGYNAALEGIALGLRFWRAALAANDPRLLARGQVWGVIALVGTQNRRAAVFDQLLDAADATAEDLGDADLRAWSLRWRADSHHMYGEPARARELFVEAAAWIADRCVGNGTLRRFCLVASARMDIALGQLDRARRTAEPVFLDAIERGDPVASRAVTAAVLAPVALAAGDSEGAARALARVASESRCATAIYEAEATAAIALYRGRPSEAVEAWRRRWRTIEEGRMLAPPGFRVAVVRSLANSLIARGERGDAREAKRHLRTLRRYRFAQAAAVRAAIEVNLELRRGRRAEAAALLETAARHFDEARMPLDAAACRHRWGELIGGDEGEDKKAVAAAELETRGVADPPRWVSIQFPPLE